MTFLDRLKNKKKNITIGLATMFATLGSMNVSAQEQQQDQKLQKEFNTFVKTLPANMQEQIKNNPEARYISWRMFVEGGEKDVSEGQNQLKDDSKSFSGNVSVKENSDFQELRSQVLSSRYLIDDKEYCVGGYLNEKGELVGGCQDLDRNFARQQVDAKLKAIHIKSLKGGYISAEELAIFDLKQEQGKLSRNVRDEKGRIVTQNKIHQTKAPIKKAGLEK